MHFDNATRSRARIRVEIGYTQAHHINVVPVPYKTVMMLKNSILIIYTCTCRYSLISQCHRGQVDGRFYARFGWSFGWSFLCERLRDTN